MTSELKSATARTNGAKSRGPKSAETRQKSSRNSLTHGLTAKNTIVLASECDEDFQNMLAYYAETYRPGSEVETDLVDEMVAARWRMQRLRLIETALIDSEIERALPDNDTPNDAGYQIAFAFRRLVDGSRAISLASRYESRLHRMHERNHRTLRELQQTRNPPAAEPAAPVPGQPEPPEPVVSPEPEPKNRETNLRPFDRERGFNGFTERGFNSSTWTSPHPPHRYP